MEEKIEIFRKAVEGMEPKKAIRISKEDADALNVEQRLSVEELLYACDCFEEVTEELPDKWDQPESAE